MYKTVYLGIGELEMSKKVLYETYYVRLQP